MAESFHSGDGICPVNGTTSRSLSPILAGRHSRRRFVQLNGGGTTVITIEPIGKLRDVDTIRLRVDTHKLEGAGEVVSVSTADLAARPFHAILQPNSHVPVDTLLWSAQQNTSGGTWAGCMYDAPRIEHLLKLGLAAEAAGANQADPTKTF